ncbi:hypothetical protein ACIO1C_18340 [Streptomyces sp. NPDC087420]|uniref:hypothetical protein n=1 Tax=Streptomyces sp. NPDC087420 TaxID=3365785 RepID=UPI003835F111
MSENTAEKTPEDQKPTEDDKSAKDEKKEGDENAEEPRPPAWLARQDLIEHSPGGLTGGLVGGNQYGMAGGEVHGNLIYQFGAYAPAEPPSLSGEIPADDLAELSLVFTESPRFGEALARLREERVLVLTGSRDTGRRTAGLMLLHRLGFHQIRTLPSDISPVTVRGQLDGSAGYLLPDVVVSRNSPLRQVDLHALRERLVDRGSHLVITLAESSAPRGLKSFLWEPPTPEGVLESYVSRAQGVEGWDRVRNLTAVRTFLGGSPTPKEAASFGLRLIPIAAGTATEDSLDAFGEQSVQTRIESWLTDDDLTLHDRAFLISLAVFDKAPYALAGELADDLFLLLQKIKNPREREDIPLFGAPRGVRLSAARARGYEESENTVWGRVPQYKAAFQEPRYALQLLDTVWMRYPSTRPALVSWLSQLAVDGRPLVRTRASAAAALLTRSDLSSGLAHLVEPWADGRSHTARLAAANTLTLAHLMNTEAVPRILRAWCTGDEEGRRWTAIRAYGLLGPVLPDEALEAVLTAARAHQRKPDLDEHEEDQGAQELVEAIELLLLSARGPVLADLAKLVEDERADRTVRALARAAFLAACEQADSELDDRFLVLEWYGDAVNRAPAEARQLSALWRAVLNDPVQTGRAVQILRDWVRGAQRFPEAEEALSRLFGDLAQEPAERQRLGHLLRTLSVPDGVSRLPVADRLLAVVPQ